MRNPGIVDFHPSKCWYRLSKYAESDDISCRNIQKVMISVVKICRKLWYQLSKYAESYDINCRIPWQLISTLSTYIDNWYQYFLHTSTTDIITFCILWENYDISCRNMQKIMISIAKVCRKCWYWLLKYAASDDVMLSKYSESYDIGCQSI